MVDQTWSNVLKLVLFGTGRHKYSFPPSVRVSFTSSRPQSADFIEEDQGGMNFIYWPEVHIIKD